MDKRLHPMGTIHLFLTNLKLAERNKKMIFLAAQGEVAIMKKMGTVLFCMFLILNLSGCASFLGPLKADETTDQDMAAAQAALKRARSVGAATTNNHNFAAAKRYYRLAQEYLKKEPRGRLTTSLLQRKDYKEKAAKNARLAKQSAELALRSPGSVSAAKPIIARAAPLSQIQLLQNKIRQLKEKMALCQKDLVYYKEQSPIAERSVEEQPATAVYQEDATGPKEVKEIQFKFLSGAEEQVIFVLNQSFSPKTLVIKGRKPRLVCDFFGAHPGRKIPLRINVGGDLIKRIRTWNHKGPNPKLRVVLDLTYPFKHRIQQHIVSGKRIFIVKLNPA